MDKIGKTDTAQCDMEQETTQHEDLQQERKSRGEAREKHLEAGRALAGSHSKDAIERQGREGREEQS